MQKQLLFSAAMVISLTACGNSETAAPVNKTADQDQNSLSKDAKAPSANLALTKEFMTGKWALESDGDCTLAQNFKADGSVDGFFQKWSLEGSKMQVQVEDESMTFVLKIIDANRVEAVMNGKTDHMVRC